MKNITRIIPNTITCLNILAGTVACIMAMGGDQPSWCGLQSYQWAYIFIGIAAVADFCDGLAARLLHAYSDMGKELDSLCDAVSFGVAPGLLFYSTMRDTQLPEHQWIGWIGLIIPVLGALRLAKFNIDSRQATDFIGLPIPANAIFWIGFTATVIQQAGAVNIWVLLITPIIVSYLMVSNLPLFSLKFKSLRFADNWRRYFIIFLAPVMVLMMGVPGLMWLIIVYILLSGVTARTQAN